MFTMRCKQVQVNSLQKAKGQPKLTLSPFALKHRPVVNSALERFERFSLSIREHWAGRRLQGNCVEVESTSQDQMTGALQFSILRFLDTEI
jgi:hypothetical protein